MIVQFTVQVAKSPELDALIERSAKKVEKLLTVFQPELVQLHGRIVRHNAREGVVCTLNLRLPTGQMAAEQAAPTAQTALRMAREDLVEQLKKHKHKLRGDQVRRRAGRIGGVLAAPPPAEEAVAADGEFRRGFLAQYISRHVDELRQFVVRQIALRERLGELQSEQLDPDEVLDEMIAFALERAPDTDMIDRERWFYLLAVQSIRQLSRGEQMEAAEAPILEPMEREVMDREAMERERTALRQLRAALPGPTNGLQSLDRPLTRHEMSDWRRYQSRGPGEEVSLQGALADAQISSPEEITYSHEMLNLLETALLRLEPQQREDIILFALEGFTVDELASISRRPARAVRQDLERAQQALRAQHDLPGVMQRHLVRETEARLSAQL